MMSRASAEAYGKRIGCRYYVKNNKGGLYGLPDTQQFYLMFYRTDIMKQMGLTIPETWDEFKEIAKLLSKVTLLLYISASSV